MSSYIDLKKIFGARIDNDSVKKMLEQIIAWSTIFDSGEGRDLLKKKIKANYKNELSKEEIKKLLDLNFSGWGTLSRKLLDGISVELPELNSSKTSLINAMRETNLNLSELVLTNKAPFTVAIKEHNDEFDSIKNKDFSYESLVENLFLSPSVKRMLWQTLLLVDEIKRLTKAQPKKIFIEMARGKEADAGRTKSRKSLLENLYKNCKKDVADWKSDIDKLRTSVGALDNLKLRSDKLYLYYTQIGKCAYSGKSIDIGRLFESNYCDIDHIYPQSKIKDDSFNNRVLVVKDANQAKKDIYPLAVDIRNKQKTFWQFLLKNEFITKEKFARLTRSTDLSADEIGGFLARQLVETRQATKKTAEVLKSIFPNTEIVYSKAGHISDFRQEFGLHKCRELNNFHHAKDAYLNIVVGNILNVKFTKNPYNFVKQKSNKKEYQSYNFKNLFKRMFEKRAKNIRAWDEQTSKNLIINTLERNTPICTRHSFCKTGGFFDQTIMKKGKGQFPLKASTLITQEEKDSIQKYGGYNKPAAAYYVLVEHKPKTQLIRSLEVVPLYLVKSIEKNSQVLIDYLTHTLATDEFEIIIPKIKINSLFIINGFVCHITGKTNDYFLTRNGVELHASTQEALYFKRILKSNQISKEKARFKKTYDLYKNRTLVEYVKKELCNKSEKEAIDEQEFELALGQKNIEVYDKFVELHKSVYKERPNSSTLKILETGRDKFKDLELSEQLVIIEKVLKLFRPINEAVDLKKIGGASFAGLMSISKNLSSLKSCFLVNQSVTGVYESKIDLLRAKPNKKFSKQKLSTKSSGA